MKEIEKESHPGNEIMSEENLDPKNLRIVELEQAFSKFIDDVLKYRKLVNIYLSDIEIINAKHLMEKIQDAYRIIEGIKEVPVEEGFTYVPKKVEWTFQIPGVGPVTEIYDLSSIDDIRVLDYNSKKYVGQINRTLMIKIDKKLEDQYKGQIQNNQWIASTQPLKIEK